MSVSQTLQSRFTCRGYKDRPLERDLILQILEVATCAPSWGNTQPWEIFVAAGEPLNRLRETYWENFQAGTAPHPELPFPPQWPAEIAPRYEGLRAERARIMGSQPDDPQALKASMGQNYRFFDAPAVVYLCLDRTLTPWSIFDMGGLAQSIMLAARELGVDSTPAVALVAFPELIRAELAIPDHLMILFGIALGYADREQVQNRLRSARRPIQEVVTFKN